MARGKLVLGLPLSWLLILICFASAQGLEEGVNDASIRIGILCSLSGSASLKSKDFLDGVQTFFNHVNDVGGIHERSVVLLVKDTGADPDQGVAATRRMVTEEGIFAIVSTLGVPTTRAIIDQGILSDQIPALAVEALSKSLLNTFRRNVFFLGITYRDQITLAIEYVLKRNPGKYPRMGLLYQDSFLGEEVGEGFRLVCKHYGLEIVGEERYDSQTYEFAPLLNRLSSTQADHIVLGATAWETAEIMREASSLGWFPQFIGCSSTAEPEILTEAEESADGYLVADYLAKPWERVPGVSLMLGHTQRYFPRKDTNSLHRNHLLGYLSGLLVGEALKRVGRELTREAFIDVLEGIHNLKTHGLAGVVGYKAGSRLSNARGRVFHFDTLSGRFLPVTDWSRPMLKGGQ